MTQETLFERKNERKREGMGGEVRKESKFARYVASHTQWFRIQAQVGKRNTMIESTDVSDGADVLTNPAPLCNGCGPSARSLMPRAFPIETEQLTPMAFLGALQHLIEGPG